MGARTSVTWTQFLRSQAAVACNFATVDTALLRRGYLLFIIDIAIRGVIPSVGLEVGLPAAVLNRCRIKD